MPRETSNVQTLPSAYEKHVSMRSGKQTTYALSKPKGNAVKDQHRNATQPTPRLFRPAKTKRPLPFAAFKLNFSFLSTQKAAEAKNLISQDGRTTEGTHINTNKE
jgi:hypothetical protein